MSLFAEDKTVTITGTVFILNENALGEPTAIAIVVDDGKNFEKYRVVLNQKGAELLELVDKVVTVTGTLVVRDKQTLIRVSSWKSDAKVEAEKPVEESSDTTSEEESETE